MLQLAHLVMTRLDRLIGLLDHHAGFAREIAAFESGLELLLEVILAALDFVDHRGFVAAGNRCLEVKETLVGLAEERAVVLRIATEPGDFRAQQFDCLAAFVGALAEQLRKAAVALDIAGRVLVAGDAVNQRRNQRVEVVVLRCMLAVP